MDITYKPGARRPGLAFDFSGWFGPDADMDEYHKGAMALAKAMGYDPVDTPPTPVGSVVEVTERLRGRLSPDDAAALVGIQCVVGHISGEEYALEFPKGLGITSGGCVRTDLSYKCDNAVWAKPHQFLVVRRAGGR